jgi:hypothetical protein
MHVSTRDLAEALTSFDREQYLSSDIETQYLREHVDSTG